jgi:hypothetical protein
MKLLSLVFSSISLVASGNPINNSDILKDFCEKRANGNFANPDSCETFITCAHKTTWVMNCPGDLKYDAGKDQCDYPENVVCGNGGDSETILDGQNEHDGDFSRSDQAVSMNFLAK